MFGRGGAGRIVTDADMRVVGLQNVWGGGDCAYIPERFLTNERLSIPRPNLPKGRVAKRQPILYEFFEVSQLVRFISKTAGQLCSIGGRRAVAEMFGLSAFLDSWRWFLWRGVYLQITLLVAPN